MKLKTIIPLLFILLFNCISNAYTPQGGHIYVKSIDSAKYEVTIHMFRDCSSTPLNSISLQVRTGTTNEVLVPTKISIQTIPVFSPRQNNNYCIPQNSPIGSRGLERHTYVDTVDFTQAPFNTSTWANACEVIFYVSYCCKSSQISTVTNGVNFYIDAVYNKCLAPSNNTPIIKNDPVHQLQVDKPFYFKYDVEETDGDSIAFKFTGLKNGYNSFASYNLSPVCNRFFSNEMQMTPFLPNPCASIESGPNKYPPVGIYLNDSTGEFIFTPTEEDEIGVITLQVEEWRKDNSNTPQLISKVHFEMGVENRSYPLNDAPQILTPIQHNFTAGQNNCITILFKDDSVAVSPPQPNPPDTLQVFWTDTIAGASFTVNENVRTKPASFCWTPSCDDVRQEPYMFTVNVRDGYIPLEVRVARVFRINVKKPNAVNLGLDKNICEGDSITLNAGVNNKQWLWSNNDTSHAITVADSGKYYVRVISNCGDTTFDTVNVSLFAKPDISLPADTIICEDDSLVLEVGAPNAISYKWNTGQVTSKITIDSAGKYKVNVYDAYCGVFSDSITVESIRLPQVDLGPDKPYCKNVNKTLSISADSILSVLWSTNEITEQIYITEPDKYWVEVTTLCGVAKDTVNFSDTTTYLGLDLGTDTIVCNQDSLTLSINRNFEEYNWSTTEVSKQIVVKQSGKYYLTVKKCTQYETDSITVDFISNPIVNLGADMELDSPFSIQLDAGTMADSYLWNTNESTKTITVTSRGTYWVEATNICGSDRDSITIIVNSILKNTAIAESIKVYPNPVIGNELTIDFTEAKAQDISISVVALTGKEVYTEKVRVSGNQKHSIHLDGLSAGIYFLQLKSIKGNATIKLVVN